MYFDCTYCTITYYCNSILCYSCVKEWHKIQMTQIVREVRQNFLALYNHTATLCVCTEWCEEISSQTKIFLDILLNNKDLLSFFIINIYLIRLIKLKKTIEKKKSEKKDEKLWDILILSKMYLILYSLLTMKSYNFYYLHISWIENIPSCKL